MITVVIRTICRPSLVAAIESARRELLSVIVSSDGVQFSPELGQYDDVVFTKLPQHLGHYGCEAFNTGASLATTEYIGTLDDDDEFAVGAGDIIRKAIRDNPAIDVWIPGLKYKGGQEVCLHGPIKKGGVACPIMKKEVIVKCPLTVAKEECYQDYYHIDRCSKAGFNIGWLQQVCILVRPQLPGTHGQGK